jgi:1-acyl-sn-glycerol-3-phosphate acyltransferase
VPVVPVALSGTKDLWFRKRIRVVIGKAIQMEGFDADTLTAVAYRKVKELMPTYREQPGRKWFRKQLTNLF